MKKSIALWAMLCIPMVLYTADELPKLSSFQIGDPFDEKIVAEYKERTTKAIADVDALASKSDLARIVKRMGTDLNAVTEDKIILQKAQEIDAEVKNNAEIIAAFCAVRQAAQSKAPIDERRKKWDTYRVAFGKQFEIFRKRIPGIVTSSDDNFISKNAHVSFTKEQEVFFIATTLVFVSGLQHIKYADPEFE